MTQPKPYVTTAIPYANGAPHIGHVLDYLIADVWTRRQIMMGNSPRFSAGLDEHGSKVEQKAADIGQTPQQFVDDLVPKFQELLKKLNAATTDYVRTTDPDHQRRVQEIWRKLAAKTVGGQSLIYKSTYDGWYCVGCEKFVTDSEARALNFICPDHQKPLEKLSEENYYLRVSVFTEEIRRFARERIVPSWRGKEILQLIKNGAQDVSISRPASKLKWGVPVPDDPDQVMYVWIDALSNYLTALGYPDKNWASDYWPAGLEVVGKDILRFHAIIWPAMLLGLDLPLPEKLLAHGFVNIGGAKMSKSVGNVIDPLQIIDDYGADALRYYFLRHVPTFDDGDFTFEKFEAAYNGELANDLGNLVSRVANMVKKYQGGEIQIAAGKPFPPIAPNLPESDNWSKDYDAAMDEFRYDAALETVWKLVQACNRYIDEAKPWQVAKENPSETAKILNRLVGELQGLSLKLKPFLPETSDKIRRIFWTDKIPDDVPILFPKKFLHSENPTAKK
ncbi:MAG: methionine--tRNA ligase [Candidatus Nomurabacteria bacterium]|jgi:methionyl-tRNA synthetase|nr:methionine--tRNA ligase [Candidatus Nomurabacteria bacterium]